MIPVVCAEDEFPSGPQRSGRVPDDFRRHAQVADYRIEGVASELVVRGLLHVSPDELGVANVPDARVCTRVHQFHPVEVHADDSSAGRRSDERQPPFSCADIQHVPSPEIFMAELVQEHGPQFVLVLRRVPPVHRAVRTDDLRQAILVRPHRGNEIRAHRCAVPKATRL